MTRFLILGMLLTGGTAAFAAPCALGSLQDYLNLGAGGCNVGPVFVNNFQNLPGQFIATPINPSQIQVSPGGSLTMPALTFARTTTAGPGNVLESFFRFNAGGNLGGGSIALNGASATGDAAVTGVLDVCAAGSFAGGVPAGCSGMSRAAIASVISGPSFPSDSVQFPPSTKADVFVDLTVDGGLSGSATFTSATVAFVAVPEPASGWLLGAGFAAALFLRLRRGSNTPGRKVA